MRPKQIITYNTVVLSRCCLFSYPLTNSKIDLLYVEIVIVHILSRRNIGLKTRQDSPWPKILLVNKIFFITYAYESNLWFLCKQHLLYPKVCLHMKIKKRSNQKSEEKNKRNNYLNFIIIRFQGSMNQWKNIILNIFFICQF